MNATMYRALLSDGTTVRFYFDGGQCRLAWRLSDRVFGVRPRPAHLPAGASDRQWIEAAVSEVAAGEGPRDLRVLGMQP